jgi:translation initiation factor 1
MSDDQRLVYSTDGSLPLPGFGRERKAQQPGKQAVPDDGVVRVGCERRRGGSVTTVHGVDPRELARVAAELKRRCGAGGSVKDGVVVLQGDHRDAVVAHFAAAGRRAKRMGG